MVVKSLCARENSFFRDTLANALGMIKGGFWIATAITSPRNDKKSSKIRLPQLFMRLYNDDKEKFL
ncbi:hypothetical protein B6S12_09820 [Helicobacter valdiviensis]|uniref:Uncharacterized protein n=1 Tax=Helicobacter valdiviensis TaxID=1458358 RepID=A0A2W6NEB9_9HELI|nr:hypothetical protein [Helicobacter valdiviensis]PZT47300.1 hypothetical protein B6S12_09820 [Helicobacter valdiviensis]